MQLRRLTHTLALIGVDCIKPPSKPAKDSTRTSGALHTPCYSSRRAQPLRAGGLGSQSLASLDHGTPPEAGTSAGSPDTFCLLGGSNIHGAWTAGRDPHGVVAGGSMEHGQPNKPAAAPGRKHPGGAAAAAARASGPGHAAAASSRRRQPQDEEDDDDDDDDEERGSSTSGSGSDGDHQDEDEDAGGVREDGAGAAPNAGGQAQRADADPLFGAELDDADERWMQRARGGRASDALLSCPGCFTTVCIECQQHALYHTQYRAVFAQHVVVDRSHPVTTQQRGRSAKRARPSEVHWKVLCEVCDTELGAMDEEEVYHFYHVFPSNA